ncbi:MAG: hypothetical protein IJX72_00180 [Clostridia bacterium]|nr:hypothetical protein [Clostridia bacterium]
MFNDERINQTCGRIYQRGILFAVLYTALFTVTRILFTGGFGGLNHYLTEAAILLFGVGILLIGLIRWGFSRDERAAFERHTYYLTAGKVFIIAALAGYAISIPLRARVSNDYPVNELILHLETLGSVYFFYAFKRHEVSFNYTFIQEQGWHYYCHVLLNIGKLALILLAPFAMAAMLDLALHHSFLMYLAILTGYVFSVIGLGLAYFLLSLLEKLNYDEESAKSFKKGTLVAWILALTADGITVLLTVIQAVVVEQPQLMGNVPMGTVLAIFSTAINRWSYPCIIITALALCLLMEQVIHSRWVCRGVCGLLSVQAVDLVSRNLRSAVVAFAERYLDDYVAVREITDFLSTWSALVWILSLIFTCLWIYGLIRDCGASKLLWLTVGMVVLCQALGIFFGSQSMTVASAVAVSGGELIAAVIRLVMLAKGSLRKVE